MLTYSQFGQQERFHSDSLVFELLLLASAGGHEFEEERGPHRSQVNGHAGQRSSQNHVFAPVTDGTQNRLSHISGVPTRRCGFVQNWKQCISLSVNSKCVQPFYASFFCFTDNRHTHRTLSPPYLEPSPVTALTDRLVRMYPGLMTVTGIPCCSISARKQSK